MHVLDVICRHFILRRGGEVVVIGYCCLNRTLLAGSETETAARIDGKWSIGSYATNHRMIWTQLDNVDDIISMCSKQVYTDSWVMEKAEETRNAGNSSITKHARPPSCWTSIRDLQPEE